MSPRRIWNYPFGLIAWGLSNKTWGARDFARHYHDAYNVRGFCLQVPQPRLAGLVPQETQIADLRQVLREITGCYFGVWISLDDWDEETALAQVALTRPNFLVVNAEGPRAAEQAGSFLRRFRAGHPALPLGVVTNFGGMESAERAQVWRDFGAVCLPEAYQDYQSNLTPVEMVFQGIQHGWAERDVFPVLGVHGGYGLAPYQSQIPRLQGWGMFGLESSGL